jgi:hypothetical protein
VNCACHSGDRGPFHLQAPASTISVPVRTHLYQWSTGVLVVRTGWSTCGLVDLASHHHHLHHPYYQKDEALGECFLMRRNCDCNCRRLTHVQILHGYYFTYTEGASHCHHDCQLWRWPVITVSSTSHTIMLHIYTFVPKRIHTYVDEEHTYACMIMPE